MSLGMAFLFILLLPAGQIQAHPGRLRADGCHVVRKDFTYRDGRVLKAGEEHCHRRLDQGFALDGKERLAPEPDESITAPDDEDTNADATRTR